MPKLTRFTISPPDRRGKIKLSGAVEHSGVVLPFEWGVHEDEGVDQHAAHVDAMKAKAEAFVAKCSDCRKHKGVEYPTAFGSIVFTAVGVAYDGPEHWHLRAFWEERRADSVRCRRREVTVSHPDAADADALVAAIVAEYPPAAQMSKMAASGQERAVEQSGHQKHKAAMEALLG
jgi:hypothetical protein